MYLMAHKRHKRKRHNPVIKQFRAEHVLSDQQIGIQTAPLLMAQFDSNFK